MILAIDIGNTNIVIGCIDDGDILFVERLSTNQTQTVLEYAISFKNVLELYHLSPEQITGSIISSVVPPVVNIVKEAIFKNHRQARHGSWSWRKKRPEASNGQSCPGGK